jgi:hypothetical protein
MFDRFLDMLLAEGAKLRVHHPKVRIDQMFFKISHANQEMTRELFDQKVTA